MADDVEVFRLILNLDLEVHLEFENNEKVFEVKNVLTKDMKDVNKKDFLYKYGDLDLRGKTMEDFRNEMAKNTLRNKAFTRRELLFFRAGYDEQYLDPNVKVRVFLLYSEHFSTALQRLSCKTPSRMRPRGRQC